MSELLTAPYDGSDEDLQVFYMFEIEVDGIHSSYLSQDNRERTVVQQPMFELKGEVDFTPSMRWSPREIDEEVWLKKGKIVAKD